MEVPVPESRRVTSEHEGKYKVTMPAGKTAKTKQILEQQQTKKDVVPKSTVFDRLGAEHSATVDEQFATNPQSQDNTADDIVVVPAITGKSLAVGNRKCPMVIEFWLFSNRSVDFLW